MLQLKETKIKTDLGSYGIRKSKAVEIIDIAKIPTEYIRTKIEALPDKVKIGEFLKNNGKLEGAILKENYSLQIK